MKIEILSLPRLLVAAFVLLQLGIPSDGLAQERKQAELCSIVEAGSMMTATASVEIPPESHVISIDGFARNKRTWTYENRDQGTSWKRCPYPTGECDISWAGFTGPARTNSCFGNDSIFTEFQTCENTPILTRVSWKFKNWLTGSVARIAEMKVVYTVPSTVEVSPSNCQN